MDALDSRLYLKVASFLGTISLAKWQAVDASTLKAFEIVGSSNVWRTCAQREFAELIADRTFYAGEHRTAILRCHMLCCRANYALGPALHMNDIEYAKVLSCHLHDSHSACAAHRALVGGDAQVLFGWFDLRFPSRGTLFRCGANDKPCIAGLPAGVLKVKMDLDGGDNLMVSTTYTADTESELGQRVPTSHVRGTLDVASVDPPMMSFCDVPLALDGTWQFSVRGRRVTSPTRNRAYSGQLMLCVLRVMEGDHCMTRVNSFSSTSSLDEVV
eukprot:TRINITY_DN7894_c0_g4_i1.p1 TRINITY_DN7894_c0_g4~~TRINITY_DN7894_c0_g4_i1.p1  ORF type:complete len:272 (+),score=31.08 TRINITY_DN7894_c0_g4_i1:82-897(+)